jgi:hypothetical protein
MASPDQPINGEVGNDSYPCGINQGVGEGCEARISALAET